MKDLTMGPKVGDTWRRTVRHSSDETYNFACISRDDAQNKWFIWHDSSSGEAFVISKDDFFADRENWQQVFEVWTLAEHDMCDSVNGGDLMGTVAADSWEDACRKVFGDRNDNYWKPERPTYFWGNILQRSRAEALKHISDKHPMKRHQTEQSA